MRLGLTGKLVLCVAVAALFSILLVGLTDYHAGRLVLKAELRETTETIAHRLALSLQQPVYEFATATIRDTLVAEFPNPDVAAIMVWAGDHHRVLAGLERTPLEIKAVKILPDEPRWMATERRIVASTGGDDKPVTVGVVRVVVDPFFARQRLLGSVLRKVAALAIALLLSLAILGFIAHRYLVKPLESMRGAMTLVARSALEKAAHAGRVADTHATGWNLTLDKAFSELHDLAAAFKSMGDAITNRQRAVRESERNLRITLDSIGDAVIATDAAGCITRMNPVAAKLTGWTPEEAGGKPLDEVFRVVDGERRTPVPSPLASVLRTGATVNLIKGIVLLARDGGERHIADSAAPIRNEEDQVVGAVLVFRDVTDQVHMEQQMRQSDKLRAIGQLAGGIAHDSNNQLGGIIGYADLMLLHLEEPLMRDYAEKIVTICNRASELNKQLLAFARQGKYLSVPVNIHAVVTEVMGLAQHSFDRRIKLQHDLGAKPSLLMGDPTQLQNALLNLALNARDAMPGGGTLTFSTKNVVLDETFCRNHLGDATPGPHIEVCVADTGTGMDEVTLKRIFEPFFTTKEPGKGTGLGLASVYGTVSNHHGTIVVYSEVNRGTAFKLYLPGVGGGPDLAIAPVRAAVRGAGRILLVDDEESILDSGAALLKSIGYEVTLARDGAEAVAIYRERGTQVDLVILDLIMPTRSGRDVFYDMRAMSAKARILISSGYSVNEEAQGLLDAGAAGFIQKPFQLLELSQKVAAALKAS